ncbi:hypothetical protein EDD15DRAFT_1739995 [Pisolithus albus]|nr:hypothetical protein EDD15DRAFT_1739995 [Pisolithus albus]
MIKGLYRAPPTVKLFLWGLFTLGVIGKWRSNLCNSCRNRESLAIRAVAMFPFVPAASYLSVSSRTFRAMRQWITTWLILCCTKLSNASATWAACGRSSSPLRECPVVPPGHSRQLF